MAKTLHSTSSVWTVLSKISVKSTAGKAERDILFLILQPRLLKLSLITALLKYGSQLENLCTSLQAVLLLRTEEAARLRSARRTTQV